VGEASDEDNSDLDLSDVDEEGKLDVRNIYECQKRMLLKGLGH
jgi:hypothetical protein